MSLPGATLILLVLAACGGEQSGATPAPSAETKFEVSPRTAKAGEQVKLLSAPKGETWKYPGFVMSKAQDGQWEPRWMLVGSGPGDEPAWQTMESALPIFGERDLAGVKVVLPNVAGPGVYQLCGNANTACATVTVVD